MNTTVTETEYGAGGLYSESIRNGIFIVVPAYNEASDVGRVVGELKALCPNVVVVDDGSADRTSEMALGAGATVLRHLMNRGQGAALQTGIEYSLKKGADVIVTFDADGQHAASDVAALLHPIVDGFADVVLGSRFLGKAENIPLSRWVVLKCGLVFTRWTSGLKLTDTHNGLRAFSRRAAQHVRFINDRMAHASELMDLIRKNKLHYQEVPVHIRYTEQTRKKGQSGLNALGIALGYLLSKLLK